GFGASERSLAKALSNRRKEALVVTKFGIGYKEAPNFRDSSRQRVMASIEKSLQNLNTDYVDVYMVHWPDVNTPFEETMRALDDLVQQGKVRAVGISNFRLSQIETSMQTRRVDVAQYCWNMFDRRMQKEIYPYCRDHNIGVMAYGSLAYGLLTGTFTEDMDFGTDDWRARRGRMGGINLFQHLFGPDYFSRNLRVVEELKALAARYGKSLPQFALRWTTSNPVISTALVGCRNIAEVEDNVGALGWSISAADMQEIDAIFARQGVDPMPDVWLERD
ncbi:MAG TPA: aldo/keto reductase, partial [Candidatus Binatia bacterium]|nr:aldo/keto reductase [Candidatus Binatia bacterium]